MGSFSQEKENLADVKIALMRKREIWLPTWQGWLLLFFLVVLSGGLFITNVFSFLAITKPVSAQYMVIEAWMPDSVIPQAVKEFNKQNYKQIFLTGGPLEHGHYLGAWRTFPDVTCASLLKLGIPKEVLVSLPIEEVKTDRTYQSALNFKKWLNQQTNQIKAVNVYSVGAHSRRTHYLFQKALGSGVELGIIALEHPEATLTNWKKSSFGVKTVMTEFLGWFYARFIFAPPRND